MRNLLVPAVNFSSPLAYVCIFFGFLFNLAGLVALGIFFYAVMVLFTIVTLPVEFNASKRALQLLSTYHLADGGELQETKKVLDAAALTYVASLAQALSTMLYYVFLLTGFSRRD